MHRIVAATRNPSKRRQLASLVGGLAEVAAPPHDLSLEVDDEPPDAGSFAEIARAKAVAWSRASRSGDLVVASDGGLLIPALGSAWDPLRTRRFAGPDAGNRERADALLALAAGLEGEQRRIGWREALAVARRGRVLASWEAESPPGLLARDYDPADLAAGEGFWVPVVWLCPEFGGKRLIDLTAEERAARHDHWARLGGYLRRFLPEQLPVELA